MDFTGKRVLVTGSTRGIGRAAAEMFLAAGARVAINGRTAGSVATAAREIGNERIVATPGDVSRIDGCEAVVAAAVQQLGGLDCLVNNVGVSPLARMMDVTEEHWDRVIATNLRSAMLCAKAALPALRSSKGSIVMVSSVAGLMAGPTECFVDAVSKAGLVGMTKTLALELAADQVRVNCVCPGYIDTPGTRERNAATNGQVDRHVGGATPLNRMGTVRECASAILYLVSADAGYCTGATLVSDGGCFAQASFGTKNVA